MFDYEEFELGCTPYDEECVQLNPNADYVSAMRTECKRYKDMLMVRFPDWEKYDCNFKVNRNPYEAGDYFDVAIRYRATDEMALAFASYVEDNLPNKWSDTEVLNWSPPLPSFKVTLDDFSSYITSAAFGTTVEQFKAYLMQNGGVQVTEHPETGEETFHIIINVEEYREAETV